MKTCKNCHAEIPDEFPVKVVECRAHDGMEIWIHGFCNWRCLAEYIIKAKLVKVVAE